MKRILFLFLFGISTAYAIEHEIPLDHQQIGPHDSLNVTIDLPARSTPWEIYCSVSSDTQEDIAQIDLGPNLGFLGAAFNGQRISFPFQPILQKNNLLKILYNSFNDVHTLLVFKNTSDKNSFRVTRCYAHRDPR